MDVNNFNNFTIEEYTSNLKRFSVNDHSSLVGKKVYYSKPQYGKHLIVKWDADKAEYLLDLEGQKFWSNPFRIHPIEI